MTEVLKKYNTNYWGINYTNPTKPIWFMFKSYEINLFDNGSQQCNTNYWWLNQSY